MSIDYLDVSKFEAENHNLELLEKFGDGENEISVYLNKDNGRYYCKGPFARWDSICYIQLSKITDSAGIQEWIANMKSDNRL